MSVEAVEMEHEKQRIQDESEDCERFVRGVSVEPVR